MKRHIIVGIALMIFAVAAAAQTVPSQNHGTAPDAQPQAVVSILNPSAGAQVDQNSITVTYALTNPGASASGTPNFELRLDARDPVTTSSTTHTFTGLTPGAHSITVQLVDANGTPVTNGKAVVQFTVVRKAALKYGPQSIAAALRFNAGEEIQIADPSRPQPVAKASGALPLMSIIGFGVLLGGIASAMKSRG